MNLKDLVTTLNGTDPHKQWNKRLVRHYSSLGAISKAGKEGKNAVYTDKHLQEALDISRSQKAGLEISRMYQSDFSPGTPIQPETYVANFLSSQPMVDLRNAGDLTLPEISGDLVGGSISEPGLGMVQEQSSNGGDTKTNLPRSSGKLGIGSSITATQNCSSDDFEIFGKKGCRAESGKTGPLGWPKQKFPRKFPVLFPEPETSKTESHGTEVSQKPHSSNTLNELQKKALEFLGESIAQAHSGRVAEATSSVKTAGAAVDNLGMVMPSLSPNSNPHAHPYSAPNSLPNVWPNPLSIPSIQIPTPNGPGWPGSETPVAPFPLPSITTPPPPGLSPVTWMEFDLGGIKLTCTPDKLEAAQKLLTLWRQQNENKQ